MFVLLLVIGFPIDCLWLQLCIGSHGHVCDLGLSAHAVYLWFYLVGRRLNLDRETGGWGSRLHRTCSTSISRVR